MTRLELNSYKYINFIKKLDKSDRGSLFPLILKKNYLKKNELGLKNAISTCIITGSLKRVYKNNGFSRHLFRKAHLKDSFNNWSVKSW